MLSVYQNNCIINKLEPIDEGSGSEPVSGTVLAFARRFDGCVFCAKGQKLKLIFDGGYSGIQKYKRGHDEVWQSPLETGGWFCVSAFGRNLAPVAVNIFSY